MIDALKYNIKNIKNIIKYNISCDPGRRTCSTDIMHDCALGREGGPSAPRVEHRYYEKCL